MNEKKVYKLAEKLYNRMKDLKSPKGEWVVDKHYFLPANVLCDHAGKMGFIRILADTIINYHKNHHKGE